MTDIEIVRGYVPGAIGRVTELHGTYYQREWDFGADFEAMVATEMASFLGRYDSGSDAMWFACADERIEGSIVIDGSSAAQEGAHLRWFLVSDEARGKGIGNRLIDTAMSFCREQAYERVYLWTFEGLDAARHLYEEHGFVLTEQQLGARWGRTVNEQRFVLQLASTSATRES